MTSRSRIAVRVAVYALALLSIVAGVPKIAQMPQELGFLSSIGLAGVGVSILGVVQTAGGVMLFLTRSRFAGALLAGSALLLSSAAIFAGGNSRFGLASLLPLVLLVVVVYVDSKDANVDAV